jgi:hypothetical protein
MKRFGLRRGSSREPQAPVSGTRKELLRHAYAVAARDEHYQAEMAEIDRAFDVTVGDGLQPSEADEPARHASK